MVQPKKRPFVSLKGMETGRVTSAGKPVYKYKGEEISEKSIDIEADGKTYVIPTVIDGKLYTEDAAVAKFFNKEVEPIKVLKENIKERSKNLAEGGTVMKKQMEMFEDGGLKDEGGMIDEVSGNDVPSGSTREEVRDDIPAQLSEGEFVFPADVVRFIGLEKLMQLRQEAKQGLKQMEAMGQMGNSDEATMPDDLPFDETDLDMEDELEYNRGGVVEAANGTYVAPTVPIGSQPLGTNPMGNPMGVPQQVADGVSGSTQGTPYVPNVGKMYGAGATPYAPVSYNQLLGPSASGAPTTENVRYFNAATGQTRMIPHLVNADGTRGATLYPVPEGFVIQEEAPKEEAKKTQVQSAKVAPVDTGGDSRDQEEREREEAMYGPGGGRISLGGKIDVEKTNRLGGPVRGSSLTKGATTFGIGYTVPGSIPGIYGALANIISIGSKGVPEGGTGKFTLDGVTLTKSAEVTNAIIKDPMGSEAKSLIEQHTNARKALQDLKQSNPNLSNRQARAIVDAVVQADKIVGDDQSVTFSIENIDNRVRDAYIDAVEDASKNDDGSFNVNSYNSLPSTVQEVYNESVTQKEDEQQQYGGYTPSSLSSLSPNNDDNNQSSNDSMDAAAAGGGDSFGLFKQGGLASKKKPKVKKMKRGGLASKK